MAIVLSTHAVGHAQNDGRRYVTEAHTDSNGGVHVREYLASSGANYTTIRNTYAAMLEQWLAEAEADQQAA